MRRVFSFAFLILLFFSIIPGLKVGSLTVLIVNILWGQNVQIGSTLSMEHSLSMCHFDDLLDPSGIICTFLILCISNGGNILVHEHQVMEMMQLFPFQMFVWIHWLGQFSTTLQSSVVYNSICLYKK